MSKRKTFRWDHRLQRQNLLADASSVINTYRYVTGIAVCISLHTRYIFHLGTMLYMHLICVSTALSVQLCTINAAVHICNTMYHDISSSTVLRKI